MQLKPKTAIAFRSKEECKILYKVLEKQGLRNSNVLSEIDKGRVYICPKGYNGEEETEEHVELSYNPEDFTVDNEDPFKWTYLEAADILRNLIIAERRKHAT